MDCEEASLVVEPGNVQGESVIGRVGDEDDSRLE